jgi:hypothetical protein
MHQFDYGRIISPIHGVVVGLVSDQEDNIPFIYLKFISKRIRSISVSVIKLAPAKLLVKLETLGSLGSLTPLIYITHFIYISEKKIDLFHYRPFSIKNSYLSRSCFMAELCYVKSKKELQK